MEKTEATTKFCPLVSTPTEGKWYQCGKDRCHWYVEGDGVESCAVLLIAQRMPEEKGEAIEESKEEEEE